MGEVIGCGLQPALSLVRVKVGDLSENVHLNNILEVLALPESWAGNPMNLLCARKAEECSEKIQTRGLAGR
jgi:hypothetical protein